MVTLEGAAVVDISAGSRWERLAQSLGAELDDIVLRTASRAAALPTCRAVAIDTLRALLDPVARSAIERAHRRDDDEDLAAWRAGGETLARAGVSPDDALSVWRSLREELRRCAERCLPQAPGRDKLLLEFVESTMWWADHGMFAAAERHRDVVTGAPRPRQLGITELVHGALLGTSEPQELERAAAAAGIAPSSRWYAVRASTGPRATVETLRSFLGADRGSGALVPFEDDVAGFAPRRPRGVVPAAVGIAGPVSFAKLHEAFERATRALETACALGARGIFDLPSLGLLPVILSDGEIGDGLVERYLEPFQHVEPGAAVLQTVERYVANDRRLEVTADELGVHVNTVRYRLTRFEQQTNCSLRDTEALTEVWWALQRRRLEQPRLS